MDPTTRRQALARLKRSAAKAARSRETADRDEADRNREIVALMALGIPRGDIADAAGLHPRRLYQILDRTPPIV